MNNYIITGNPVAGWSIMNGPACLGHERDLNTACRVAVTYNRPAWAALRRLWDELHIKTAIPFPEAVELMAQAGDFQLWLGTSKSVYLKRGNQRSLALNGLSVDWLSHFKHQIVEQKGR